MTVIWISFSEGALGQEKLLHETCHKLFFTSIQVTCPIEICDLEN